MTAPDAVLENHTLVIRDGRLLDVLPTAAAAARYAATVTIDRSTHALLPGLVNARTSIVPITATGPEQRRDGALLCIADMLKAGTTCFCAMGYFPDESARTAAEQGMRALIGIPIAAAATSWAKAPGEYLTRALSFRDEFRGHPAIATAFAPRAPADLSDATFRRIATLADELDAAILIDLHQSRPEIDECMVRHGLRPLERMSALGLLTPALTASHMVHVNETDLALAQRGGIAITLCPETSLRSGNGSPPVAAWAATGLRLSVGAGLDDAAGLGLWSDAGLLSLLAADAERGHGMMSAWDALAAATRGGAAALGLDAEIGTLESGKWADVCCVDLRGAAALRASLHQASVSPLKAISSIAPQLVLNAGRDRVSDVWVAGRHLLADGACTRLDWPELTARLSARLNHLTTGES
jgi:5-methylthioadenosine/S-adenosylhomocysteine deaminase